jgi:NAD(P)-dependent dehydrogenase (short-subunit alcohol dehydrogenase family)
MLDLDVDMEADLGIDSIKRVEILGALRRQVGDQSERGEAATEELFARKTLRGIIDWMLEHAAVGSPSPAARVAAPPVPAGAAATRAAPGEAVHRSALKVVETPLTGQPAAIAEDGVVLITDDGCGIATALAQGLRESGTKVALVQAAFTTAETAPGTYACCLESVDALRDLAGVIRARQGAVAGVVHLLPARPAPVLESMDLGQWRQRLAADVESLFGLAQAFGDDLHGAAQRGGAALLAATAMGGAFGADDSADSFVGNGAVAGLAKTLALEWPDVRVRAIDLAPSAGTDALAHCLLRELYAGDIEAEVGYPAGRRSTIRVEPAPLTSTESGLAIDSSWVILVTGGARGITAEAALELARRYRPTLLLAGRSPQPPPEEDPETASLRTDRELKAAIITRMQRDGRSPHPAEVEQEHRRLLREREMRDRLRAIEASGATVRYYQVDMRDQGAVQRLLDRIYEQFGRLDGVVHGAGIIEDKLIEQKDPASFRRVFGTKADSAFLLARLLRFDTLRFLAFYSSVSGRYGNRGQGDYAAGNEVLNKLARQLDRRHPTRVVAINWGPWAEAGMVSPEVERQFRERGVLLIPRAVGVRMFDEELRWGHKGDAEVVVAGGRWLAPRGQA